MATDTIPGTHGPQPYHAAWAKTHPSHNLRDMAVTGRSAGNKIAAAAQRACIAELERRAHNVGVGSAKLAAVGELNRVIEEARR